MKKKCICLSIVERQKIIVRNNLKYLLNKQNFKTTAERIAFKKGVLLGVELENLRAEIWKENITKSDQNRNI